MLLQINRLSPRRKPPLRFLHRDNAVNRHLAILQAKLSGEYGDQAASRDTGSMRRPVRAGLQPAR
jgi:hypothetical protein